MRFLVDHQLPPALARFLSERGHLSSHVLDLGLDETPDADVWAHAAKAGMILVSKDDDFVHLANRPGDTRTPRLGVHRKLPEANALAGF